MEFKWGYFSLITLHHIIFNLLGPVFGIPILYLVEIMTGGSWATVQNMLFVGDDVHVPVQWVEGFASSLVFGIMAFNYATYDQ
mmetsp:Transcript_42570/g.65286  ORF Transcript_42570/g.65286 Transcript_42570/m.65286 type:complete len:83 (-) Transcript_42570:1771-2019(-)